jgi:flagellar motility protein MotE (MotC chaperone)
MESSESWWRKPAGVADEGETASRAGAEISGSFEDDLESKSLGEVIDQALGDFDTKLAQLREQVGQKQAEVADLEEAIGNLEKEQAKAFKDLLGSNKHIKRMLAPKPKRRAPSRRKKTPPPQAETPAARSEDADDEQLL